MKAKTVKIIISIIMLGIISFGLFVYFSFNGTPWQKAYHKGKIKDYLEKKYTEEMVIEKTIYNFKDGSYGVRAYPKNRPGLVFSAYQHYDQSKVYRDYYPEALWDYQVNIEFKDKIATIYPKAESFRFHGAMGVSGEMKIEKQVPHYKEVNPHFTLIIRINQRLSESILKAEASKLYQLAKVISETKSEVLIVYRDKQDDTKNAETYINLYQDDLEDLTLEKVEQIFHKALLEKY